MPINPAEVYVEFFKVFWELATPKQREFAETSSPTQWAASFESLLAFKQEVWRQCRTPVIRDAGAGASSAVLRLWFREVITCDGDKDYVETVKKVCHKLADHYEFPQLGAGVFMEGLHIDPVEATFYDYGNYDMRVKWMASVMDTTSRVIYLDDVDHRDRCTSVRGAAYWEARLRGWCLTDRPDLVDEFGRWGIMATRQP